MISDMLMASHAAAKDLIHEYELPINLLLAQFAGTHNTAIKVESGVATFQINIHPQERRSMKEAKAAIFSHFNLPMEIKPFVGDHCWMEGFIENEKCNLKIIIFC